MLNIHGADSHCNITIISKYEAVDILQNPDFGDKSRTLSNIIFVYHVSNVSKKIVKFGDTEVEKLKFH